MKNTFIDSTGKLQLKLTGSVASTQLDWTCSYYDKTISGNIILEGEYSGVSNNATAVDICVAPASGHIRVIKNITVYNADTATAVVILQLVDAGGTRVLIRNTLTTLASWSADDMSFYTDISGKLDTSALSDTAYGAGWDGDTTHTATKNAVYDKINTLDVTSTSTNTLTNKRITPRIISATSYTTNTGTSLNADNCDIFIVTAQAGALLFNNPGGTHTDGQKLILTVASSTTAARALTYGNAFGSTTVTLPSTTAATTATLSIGLIWSASKSLRQCVAVS